MGLRRRNSWRADELPRKTGSKRTASDLRVVKPFARYSGPVSHATLVRTTKPTHPERATNLERDFVPFPSSFCNHLIPPSADRRREIAKKVQRQLHMAHKLTQWPTNLHPLVGSRRKKGGLRNQMTRPMRRRRRKSGKAADATGHPDAASGHPAGWIP